MPSEIGTGEGTAKSAWIERVLGVRISTAGNGAGGAAGGIDAALAQWRQADEAVGEQLNSLRKILLGTSDPDLHRIAEFGLNGITGRYKVGLQAALMELDRAAPAARPAIAGKAVKFAAAFRQFVQTDKRVAACDACPATPVSISRTLGDSLARLEQALAGIS